jgi:hypothetical protein
MTAPPEHDHDAMQTERAITGAQEESRIEERTPNKTPLFCKVRSHTREHLRANATANEHRVTCKGEST